MLTLEASVWRPQLSPDGAFVAGHRFDEGETSVWVTDLQERHVHAPDLFRERP